jgi:tetratricopeptide (TPR) repeat protein
MRFTEKLLFTFCLICSCCIGHSQPGGGGGLAIIGFYDSQGRPVKKEAIAVVRTFVLRNRQELLYENYPDDPTSSAGRRYGYANGQSFIFLPPFKDESGKLKHEDVDQRVMINYQDQWMMIDFTNIPGENGGGHVDAMDSLVFQPGYFQLDQQKKSKRSNDATEKQIRQWLKSGITPYTANLLSEAGRLNYSPSINLGFLAESLLPASYYVHLGQYYFQKKMYNDVFSTIRIASSRNKNNALQCEILYLLANTYEQIQDYNNAIAAITGALRCKRSKWDEEPEADNLRYRAELLTKAGRLNEALQDYNNIINITEDKLSAQIALLHFLIEAQHDYQTAIQIVQELLSSKPDDKYEDAMGFRSDYNVVYYLMAEALYRNNQWAAAWPYYLKAEQTGYNYSSSYQPIDRFDQLIAKHPGIPELYLSRALALYQRAPYMGWGDSTRYHFQRALDDLQSAETFGYKSYLLYMYRANILNQNKQYQEALKAINKAIKKKKDHLYSYIIRYQIRSNLGLARWGDKNDSDQLIIEKIKKGLKPIETNDDGEKDAENNALE